MLAENRATVINDLSSVAVAPRQNKILTIMVILTVVRTGFTFKFQTLPPSSSGLFRSDEVG